MNDDDRVRSPLHAILLAAKWSIVFNSGRRGVNMSISTIQSDCEEISTEMSCRAAPAGNPIQAGLYQILDNVAHSRHTPRSIHAFPCAVVLNRPASREARRCLRRRLCEVIFSFAPRLPLPCLLVRQPSTSCRPPISRPWPRPMKSTAARRCRSGTA